MCERSFPQKKGREVPFIVATVTGILFLCSALVSVGAVSANEINCYPNGPQWQPGVACDAYWGMGNNPNRTKELFIGLSVNAVDAPDFSVGITMYDIKNNPRLINAKYLGISTDPPFFTAGGWQIP